MYKDIIHLSNMRDTSTISDKKKWYGDIIKQLGGTGLVLPRTVLAKLRKAQARDAIDADVDKLLKICAGWSSREVDDSARGLPAAAAGSSGAAGGYDQKEVIARVLSQATALDLKIGKLDDLESVERKKLAAIIEASKAENEFAEVALAFIEFKKRTEGLELASAAAGEEIIDEGLDALSLSQLDAILRIDSDNRIKKEAELEKLRQWRKDLVLSPKQREIVERYKNKKAAELRELIDSSRDKLLIPSDIAEFRDIMRCETMMFDRGDLEVLATQVSLPKNLLLKLVKTLSYSEDELKKSFKQLRKAKMRDGGDRSAASAGGASESKDEEPERVEIDGDRLKLSERIKLLEIAEQFQVEEPIIGKYRSFIENKAKDDRLLTYLQTHYKDLTAEHLEKLKVVFGKNGDQMLSFLGNMRNFYTDKRGVTIPKWLDMVVSEDLPEIDESHAPIIGKIAALMAEDKSRIVTKNFKLVTDLLTKYGHELKGIGEFAEFVVRKRCGKFLEETMKIDDLDVRARVLKFIYGFTYQSLIEADTDYIETTIEKGLERGIEIIKSDLPNKDYAGFEIKGEDVGGLVEREIRISDEFKKILQQKCAGFTLRILDRYDERGLYLGKLTSCCQSIDRDSKVAVEYGMRESDAGFLVLEDKRKKIAAQSLFWTNSDRNTVVLDSIEHLETTDEDVMYLMYSLASLRFKELRPELEDVKYGLGGNTPKLFSEMPKTSTALMVKVDSGFKMHRGKYKIKSSGLIYPDAKKQFQIDYTKVIDIFSERYIQKLCQKNDYGALKKLLDEDVLPIEKNKLIKLVLKYIDFRTLPYDLNEYTTTYLGVSFEDLILTSPEIAANSSARETLILPALAALSLDELIDKTGQILEHFLNNKDDYKPVFRYMVDMILEKKDEIDWSRDFRKLIGIFALPSKNFLEVKFFRELIASPGIDIHAVDDSGRNIFDYLVIGCHDYLLRDLYANGVETPKEKIDGYLKALIMDTKFTSQKLDIYKLLIENSAYDFSAVDDDGNNILDYLIINSDFNSESKRILEYLQQKGVRSKQENVQLLFQRSLENRALSKIWEYLIKMPGFDINQVFEDDQNALDIAIENDDIDAVEIILREGFVIDLEKVDSYFRDIMSIEYLTIEDLGQIVDIINKIFIERYPLDYFAVDENDICLIDLAYECHPSLLKDILSKVSELSRENLIKVLRILTSDDAQMQPLKLDIVDKALKLYNGDLRELSDEIFEIMNEGLANENGELIIVYYQYIRDKIDSEPTFYFANMIRTGVPILNETIKLERSRVIDLMLDNPLFDYSYTANGNSVLDILVNNSIKSYDYNLRHIEKILSKGVKLKPELAEKLFLILLPKVMNRSQEWLNILKLMINKRAIGFSCAEGVGNRCFVEFVKFIETHSEDLVDKVYLIYSLFKDMSRADLVLLATKGKEMYPESKNMLSFVEMTNQVLSISDDRDPVGLRMSLEYGCKINNTVIVLSFFDKSLGLSVDQKLELLKIAIDHGSKEVLTVLLKRPVGIEMLDVSYAGLLLEKALDLGLKNVLKETSHLEGLRSKSMTDVLKYTDRSKIRAYLLKTIGNEPEVLREIVKIITYFKREDEISQIFIGELFNYCRYKKEFSAVDLSALERKFDLVNQIILQAVRSGCLDHLIEMCTSSPSLFTEERLKYASEAGVDSKVLEDLRRIVVGYTNAERGDSTRER